MYFGKNQFLSCPSVFSIEGKFPGKMDTTLFLGNYYEKYEKKANQLY